MTTVQANDAILVTVAAVKAAESKYDQIKNDSSLGNTFLEAGRGLSLINETLGKVEVQAYTNNVQTAKPSLEICKNNAASLEAIFKQMFEKSPAERKQVYWAYINENGRDKLVENLVIRMMELVDQIATNCAIEANMHNQLQTALTALKKLRETTPSVPLKQNRADHHYENSGAGYQFNAPGGTQNNSLGPAPQFVGGTFPGTISFGHFGKSQS